MGSIWRRRRSLVVLAALPLLLSGCWYSLNVPWDAGPIDDPVIVETFRIGPYDLAPMGTPGWEVMGTPAMPRPSGDVAVKSLAFDVVDSAGRSIGVDKVHLHHIVMLNRDADDSVCPGRAERFGGTGMERTELRLLGDYAYRAAPGDRWASNFHLHTTSPSQADGVYIEYRVSYERVEDASQFRFTTPYFLDVAGCNAGSVYDVPGGGGPDSEHVVATTYTAPRDGVAVFAGGHLHAGGIDLSLTRDRTGEDYCTSTASYAPGGHPNHPNLGQLQKISSCLMHSEVRAGDRFTLRSNYDGEHPVSKAMGIMLVHTWEPSA